MAHPIEYARPEAYPEITGAADDPVAVREIRRHCCSAKSETTAVLQYFYHHFVSNKFAKDGADIFMRIGKVEMKHMELLAEAIIKFGGDPIDVEQCGIAISGSWINYAKGLRNMLAANMSAEAGAIENYRKSAEIVENRSLKALFLRLAEDAEIHLSVLRQLLEREECWR